jgi:putative IMPACT (imprinted ancient) family translation regulator
MLEVIKGNELKNVAIVVTRYFGGVLLGTGGLVRAYGGAAQLGVEAAEKVRMELLNKIRVTTDYNSFGRLKNITDNIGAVIEDSEFTDNVASICLCDEAGLGVIQARMNEATAGKCKIELLEKNYFPVK